MNPTQDFDIAGVTLDSAAEWLAGKVWATHAADLDTSRCEIAFLNELGNRESYRACVAAILQLWEAGARGAIVHCCSDMMFKRYLRIGAICAMQEEIVWRGEKHQATRLIIPADAFKAWIDKVRPAKTRQIES